MADQENTPNPIEKGGLTTIEVSAQSSGSQSPKPSDNERLNAVAKTMNSEVKALDEIIRKTVIATEYELGIEQTGFTITNHGIEPNFAPPTEAQQKIIEQRVEAAKEKFFEQKPIVISPTDPEDNALSETKTKELVGKHADLLKGANLPDVTSRIVHSSEGGHLPAPVKKEGKGASVSF